MALIVVIILLVSAGLLSLTTFPNRPDDSPEDEDSLVGQPIQVMGRLEWKGWNGTLTRPISIEDGGHFTLDGCNITILMEDLVLWHMCPFWVRDDGRMVIRNSTIRLVQDQRLETAFFFSRFVNTNFGKKDRTPWISRVVNLEGTDDPILSFDLSWRTQNTNLLVLGQSSPDRGFQRIARIPPGGDEYGEWTHHEVSLSDIAGKVSRIAITPRNNDYGAIMIANVTVRENGTGSLNDRFPTGPSYFHGWFTWGLDPFMERLSRWMQWSPLIRCYGDIEIIDSSIGAPSNLPRYVGNWVSEWEPGEGWSYSNFVTASMGGEIEIHGGSLVLEDSRVVNVPLNVAGAIIDVNDSHIEGDAHLLTLLRSQGSVVGTRFTGRDTDVPDRPFGPEHSFDQQYLWGLSVMNNMDIGPVRVEGCSFQGCEVGLEARSAMVSLEDNRFVAIKKCAIWYRESMNMDDWEAINGTNTFLDCLGQWFLRTQPCPLERPDGESTMEAGWMVEPSPSDLPDFRFLWLGYTEGTLLVPSVVVSSSGVFMEVPRSKLVIRTTDNRFVRSEVDRGATEAVDVAGGGSPLLPLELDVEDDFYGTGSVRILPNVPLEVGTVPLFIHMRLNRLGITLADFDSILLTHDGSKERITSIFDHITTPEGVLEATVRASIPLNVGRNPFGLSIWREDQDGRRAVWNGSFTVVRATGDGELDEAIEVMTEGAGIVVLDPGVQLEVSGVPLGGPTETDRFLPTTFLFCNGSSLTMAHASNDTSTPSIVSIGNGTLRFIEMTCDGIHLEGSDGGLEIINSSFRRASFDLRRCTVGMTGLTVEEAIGRLDLVDSTLALEDSSLTFTTSTTFDLNGSQVVIDGTEISSPVGCSMGFSLRAGSSIGMSGCNFEGLSILLEPWTSPTIGGSSLEMTDCRFDAGSVLTLPRDWSDATDPPEPSLAIHLEDCEFSSVGTGVIGNGPCLESIIEANLFSDGAIALGLFDIDMDIESADGETNLTWTIMDDRGALPMVDLGSSVGPLQDCLALSCMDFDDPFTTSRSVTLSITLDWYYAPVMWFVSFDSGTETIHVLVPEWGDPWSMIEVGKISEPFW